MYFILGESLIKVNKQADALPYFERLVKEFEQSEYLEKAKARIASGTSANRVYAVMTAENFRAPEPRAEPSGRRQRDHRGEVAAHGHVISSIVTPSASIW